MTRRLLSLLIICFVVSGCSSLAGLGRNCHQDELPGDLQATLDNSCRGNKQASLEIGQYYERLATKEENKQYYKKAVSFYKLAAASSSGQTYIYVPGAGKVASYTMPVTTGPRTYGLTEAQYRLGLLYRDGHGIRQNITKACKLFNMAAARGHLEASAARCLS